MKRLLIRLDVLAGTPLWFYNKYLWLRSRGYSRKEAIQKAALYIGWNL